MKRGLLGLEDVEDIGCVVGKLVQRHPHLFLCTLHRDVHARHLPGASHSPFAAEGGETEAPGNWVVGLLRPDMLQAAASTAQVELQRNTAARVRVDD